MQRLSFVVVGHVDHGKSTLVGRLLADTGSVPEDRIERVRRICEEQRKPFEYAFLLDALEQEQLQGVTIDVTEVRFRWKEREYLIIDAPGHKEFIKNMISGAAHADAAFLLIDALEGVQEQSRRHAWLLRFLGTKSVAVIVSKMDRVDYRQEVFESLRAAYTDFLQGIDVRPLAFLPVSAAAGDNVSRRSERMPWYGGPSFLEFLEQLELSAGVSGKALRLPVQDVYKFDERRIIAGRIESGTLAVGDEIQVWPSGHTARVKSIEAWPVAPEAPASCGAGQSVGLTLDFQLFVQRGDVLADAASPPRVSSFLTGSVFWLGRQPLEPNRRYRLKMATQEREVEVFSITQTIDAASMDVSSEGGAIKQNEAGEVVFRAVRPLVFDEAVQIPSTGRFVVLDGYDVVGGGIVLEAEDLYHRAYRTGLPKSSSISPVHAALTSADRALAYGHASHVIWLTGVPGAGKSTVARRLERELFNRDIKTFVLDGENLRFGLSADLGFADQDRSEQARRAAEVARLLQHAGLVVIVALVSPFVADRQYARALVGEEHFTLVHLHAPLEVLHRRDPHGLYARAARDERIHIPGLNAPFELPGADCLAFDTSSVGVDGVCDEILRRVLKSIG
ncbi:MAG: adenylyl-sulfate kinase [Candidatus Rokubacteria bacterium RIFCSPLOWO2_12_FULL_71_22]|nr:MAG: adenylyl-sulfate kinase [Candidatus Rokubacteria bacterium RIFCSPLOWO2_12_FULL_71_22]